MRKGGGVMGENLRAEAVRAVDELRRRQSRFRDGDSVWVAVYERQATVKRVGSWLGSSVVCFEGTVWHVEVPDDWMKKI